jgi:hypothetical protein
MGRFSILWKDKDSKGSAILANHPPGAPAIIDSSADRVVAKMALQTGNPRRASTSDGVLAFVRGTGFFQERSIFVNLLVDYCRLVGIAPLFHVDR